MAQRRWLVLLSLLSWLPIGFNASAQRDSTPTVGVIPELESFGDMSSTDAVLAGIQSTKSNSFTSFTVRLLIADRKENYVSQCTGVIVAKDLILTAGHCLQTRGMRIKVLFGTGIQDTYTHILESDSYRSWHPLAVETKNFVRPLPPPKRVLKTRDPWLDFDLKNQIQFLKGATSRTKWTNYFYETTPQAPHFLDYALIKIPSTPNGYRSIEFFRGRPEFKETVFIAGYGRNHRRESRNTYSLRWTPQLVIGHFTEPGRATKGWQIYGPNTGICIGDSGGPVLVERNGEFRLLGISIITTNNCANSGWAMSPLAFTKSFEEAARSLRSELRL